MSEIDYEKEFERLKDSSFDEILNDQIFADVKEDIEEIMKTVTFEEGMVKEYEHLIRHQKIMLMCGRLVVKTMKDTELINRLKEEFLDKDMKANPEYINEFVQQFDIEQFKKQVLAHDNDKFTNKELIEKYGHTGRIVKYNSKKKMRNEHYYKIRKFQRSLIIIHKLNNPQHIKTLTEENDLPNELIMEQCIDNLSSDVLNSGLIGKWIF